MADEKLRRLWDAQEAVRRIEAEIDALWAPARGRGPGPIKTVRLGALDDDAWTRMDGKDAELRQARDELDLAWDELNAAEEAVAGSEVAEPIDAQAEYEEARKLADEVDEEHRQMLDGHFRGGKVLTRSVIEGFQALVRRRETAHDRLRTALERLWGINEPG